MAKNKKKSANVAPLLSDESYIKSGKARKLEIHKCLINDDWQETGIAQVVVMREHINGNVTAGIFLVDLLCAGVKDSFFMFNVDENLFLYKFKQMQSESMQNIVTCDYVLAHNIIYGAIEFADDFNIKPCSEFKITQMILEEDNDDVPLMDVDFGRDGKPCLIGDEDDPKTQYYLQRLRTYAGEGNFEFIAAIDDFEEGEDKDEDDFDEDDPEYKAAEEFFGHPEQWNADEWEKLFESLPEAVLALPIVADYIFEKAIANPDNAVKKLTDDLETSTVKITYEPITTSYIDSAQELKEAGDIFKKMGTQTSDKMLFKLIERLNENIIKWPDNPVFYNYINSIYNLLYMPDAAIKASQITVDKFPDYLFGKIAHGFNLIIEGRTNEVPALFNKQFSLHGVCPDREEFHISEYVAFHTLMSFYFVKIGDISRARTYRNMVDDIDIPESVPVNELILELVDAAVEECVHKLLVDARKSKKLKAELISLLMN